MVNVLHFYITEIFFIFLFWTGITFFFFFLSFPLKTWTQNILILGGCRKVLSPVNVILSWAKKIGTSIHNCSKKGIYLIDIIQEINLIYTLIGLVSRVFANGLGDLSSIPGRVIPKTLKMVLDSSLLNTRHYKVCIKSKVEQSRERSSILSYTSV